MKLPATTAALLLLASPAMAQSPLGPDAPVAGPKTKVMTLGSFHLSQRKPFDPQWLEPLMARLVAFHPDIITIEAVAGEQCEMMKVNPDRYADAYQNYCWDMGPIEKATGYNVAAANAEIRKTFDTWPSAPSAAQRRRLAMLFVAAGDRASAQVQWLRLPQAERHLGDGVTDEVLKILTRNPTKLNENVDIAAALAARLGLDRVYPVDDHSADGALAHTSPDFDKAQMARFEEYKKLPIATQNDREMATLKDGASVLRWYQVANAAGGQNDNIKADFGGAIAQQWPTYPSRQYMGWWETRNLRMAANIRESFTPYPGARVLNVVGASHKPWYDALIGQMADVEVVDASTVLR